MNPVEVECGGGPVILGLPHTGTFVPKDIAARLSPRGTELADTDWHVDRLYKGLLPDLTTVRATFHRYVIDANRDPSGASLYPGQNTTGLVPQTDFDDDAIWSVAPTADEVEVRRAAFHAPYHEALREEIERVRGNHGVAILYDCHSIRSHIPFLLEGVLPDFNIGTNGGVTCAPGIEAAVTGICAAASGYSSVLNGRFKGGWTTRHYGQPAAGVHAIQMELAQSTYLTSEAAPWTYDTTKSDRLRNFLSEILNTLADLAPALGGAR
ncbi:MAG: N-formylglutamate deformylase [Rhodospirillaceae bacterium]|nr:N-formylglutamate deformylase [Rhodospirillaceae bacterium]